MEEREFKDKNICAKIACSTCICSTCMHQGFDCDCGAEQEGPVYRCDDYDQMGGEQLSLDL